MKLIPSARAGSLPASSRAARLDDLSAPHVQSFNFMLGEGLVLAVADLPRREVRVSSGDTLRFWLEDAKVHAPSVAEGSSAAESRLFPRECRERGTTYAGELVVTLARSLNDGDIERTQHRLGGLPLMVRSARCHLASLGPAALVAAREEPTEFGGYFICNGIERVIRMLQIPKRNHPMAITRSAYTNRGPLYSDKGIVMRCTRADQSSVTLTLHYLLDGSATVRFTVKKQEFFLPVILVLKALVGATDREIYEHVLAGETSNTYLSDRMLLLLRDAKRFGAATHNKKAALAFLGFRFRAIIDVPESASDIDSGLALLSQFVLVHVPADSHRDKFNVLVVMLRKLYAFVAGAVLDDNADSLANQELLLSGHLLNVFVKEKLYEFTQGIEAQIRRDDSLATRAIGAGAATPGVSSAATEGAADDAGPTPASARAPVPARRRAPVNLADGPYWKQVVDRQPSVGRKVAYLITTGNLVTSSGLDMMQVSGYTVVADKLNFFRFTTHFRSVHRGQFFTEMKTTTVRKLLPESWGFLCPVHTPDGGPCGLLNHIAAPCMITAVPVDEPSFSEMAAAAAAVGDSATNGALAASAPAASVKAALTALLVALGVEPHGAVHSVAPANELPVMLDGIFVGSAAPHDLFRISRVLRTAKALAGATRAGVTKLGTGHLPGQTDAVAELVRAAVRGRAPLGAGAAPAVDEPGSDSSSSSGSSDTEGAPPPLVSRGLPSLGAIGIVPPSLEVAFIPPPWWDASIDPSLDADGADATARTDAALRGQSEKLTGLFPGLFLSTAVARPVRPVLQLDTGLVELLSPLEQLFLDIACTPTDRRDVLKGSDVAYTHIELAPTAMLSELASLTPFSDMNQSPRNMYQCQMSKQTMGTPALSLPHRADSKLYRLQNPQAPLVQNAMQAELALDEYPNGANACVAVIAYTGFDMEDACIINKSSFERGFGWASVYKTLQVDLNFGKSTGELGQFTFDNCYRSGESRAEPVRGAGPPGSSATPGEPVDADLDEDGLPHVGAKIMPGAALYCQYNHTSQTHKVVRHTGAEPAFIEEVRVLPPATTARTTGTDVQGLQRASIKLRFDRRPVVGDKFSSRHGQKGVLSFLWPSEDMPFTDRGMQPDVLINPHAFPSRMTIGMLIESLAGKSGALRGEFQDSTPFRFDEKQRAVDEFGAQLAAAGYAYYGTETMYSGVTGEALGVDIFYGVVYYQRLRMMVKDKAQVRSTGPINALTRQPVKGRKKGGGIRVGEMERDALLAHGVSFLLHDRLHASSDRHLALVCRACGSMLTTFSVPVALAGDAAQRASTNDARARTPMCSSCATGEHVATVSMPYVFRFLANELAAMNVKVTLKLGDVGGGH